MKVSVVTPSYNQGEYLERTLLSVINQKNADFEYIVVDGASTDCSGEILERYQDRIDCLIATVAVEDHHAMETMMKHAANDIRNCSPKCFMTQAQRP